MLEFHYEPDTSKAAGDLTARLTSELEKHDNVVWLVTGGTNVPVSAAVMEALPEDRLPRLTVMLADERYGKPGHPDSNWQQLAEAGFMTRNARFLATLIPDLTLEDTSRQYAMVVEDALAQADVVIGQLGIGGDGHIAGILPRSDAVGSTALVSAYDSGSYQRLTLTIEALRRIDAAYCYVYGETKRQSLQRLHDQRLPLSEQPAQILKELPEAHVYTDQYRTDT